MAKLEMFKGDGSGSGGGRSGGGQGEVVASLMKKYQDLKEEYRLYRKKAMHAIQVGLSPVRGAVQCPNSLPVTHLVGLLCVDLSLSFFRGSYFRFFATNEREWKGLRWLLYTFGAHGLFLCAKVLKLDWYAPFPCDRCYARNMLFCKDCCDLFSAPPLKWRLPQTRQTFNLNTRSPSSFERKKSKTTVQANRSSCTFKCTCFPCGNSPTESRKSCHFRKYNRSRGRRSVRTTRLGQAHRYTKA